MRRPKTYATGPLVALALTTYMSPSSPDQPGAIASYSGGSEAVGHVIIGGETATPSLTVGHNVDLHPSSPSGTEVFTLTTVTGGTRQGVKIIKVCAKGGCTSDAPWTVELSAENTFIDADGYLYALTGPTTYNALLHSPGPIEPGTYTVKVDTLWIY